MRTPAALPRLALGPLLLAVALGTAGFAAGWMFRPETDPSPATTPLPPSRADSGAGDARMDAPTGSTRSRAPSTPAGAARLPPAQAHARLAAWVAAGCPRLEPMEVHTLLNAWSDAAPWDALAFVHGAPQFRGRTEAYRIPLTRIATVNPEAAAAWINRELTDPGIRGSVFEGVVRLTMVDHPETALELACGARTIPSYVVSQIVDRLAFKNPPAALAWFGQRLSEAERKSHASDLAKGWLRSDPVAARDWCLQQAGTPHGEGVLRALALDLAGRAPEELGLLFALPSLPLSTRISVLHEVGYSRPDVVLDHLPGLPAKEARGIFLGMFDSLFGEDPGAAVELGRSLLPPDVLHEHVRSSWNRWADSDRPGALAWAAAIGDTDVKRQLALEQQKHEICRSPADFLAGVSTTPSDPDTRGLLEVALTSYAYREPSEAAAWFSQRVATVEPGHARTIAEVYAYQNAPAAVAWAQSLPLGPARDAACTILIDHHAVQRKVPEFASLVAGISDPVLQTQATYRVFCAISDREVAERWLDAQPLPAEVRASWIAIASFHDGPAPISFWPD